MTAAGRVLIVGLDGATWDVLAPWARAGALPALGALMERGVWGALRSTIPPLTLPAWSSFMTGRNPGAHGVYGFRRLAADRYETGGLANGGDLRSRTLWDVAGAAGRHVGAISVPPSYPLPAVNGFVVGCMLTPPGQPLAAAPDVVAELGDYVVDLPAPLGLARTDPDYVERGLPYVEGLTLQTRQRTEATLRLMRRPWDLLCVVYYAPDRLQHYFWPTISGADEAREAPAIREALRASYVALDEALGRLVAAAGPDTHVMVVSDHGFAPKPDRAVYVNRWLATRGLLRERPLWRLRRKLLRGLMRRERRVRWDTVDHMVDRARTVAWAQTLDPTSVGVWVNVRGRYPLGCIDPGAEYESLRERLVHELGELRDDGGRAVFARVDRREDVYRGPFVDEAPDVVALCGRGFGAIYDSLRRDLRARTLFGPFQELGFTGIHDLAGIYLLAGPAVRPLGEQGELPIEAIAPAALHLLDVPVPRWMEGAVPVSFLHDEHLREHPVRYSDEDTSERGGVRGWESSEDEASVWKHLRALGYVE